MKKQELVRLKCVKEGSKLRVRIISAGYNPRANCQFPRAIRVEGREYTYPATDVVFAESAQHKFFYRIMKKNNIEVLGHTNNTNNKNDNKNNDNNKNSISDEIQ